MADYREIKGLKVPYLSSDLPSASANTQEGGVWYNSSTGKLRAFIAFDTWATTKSLGTARYALAVGPAGTQTAGLAHGGLISSASALTEEYDGSAWTESGDLNTAKRSHASAGTQTACLSFGGHTTTAVAINEEYNGSAWSEEADLNLARRHLAGAGVSTAALAFGGYHPANKNESETWNGTAWTEGNNLNTARANLGGLGISTAA